MARRTLRVERGALQGLHGQPDAIAVGTPAWYAWLEQATTFAFVGEQGSFTARKERSRQSGWYWKAYRKHQGALHRAYLGKSADLTLDRLTAIASQLAQRATGPPPLVAASVLAPAPVAADDHPPLLTAAQLPTGTLTFCFSDIEGSTQLWEQHPQAMPQALARHDAIVRQAIETHGGVVFKTVGDGVHAVFIRAVDALSAALAAQRELQAAGWAELGSLRVRMALHTGAAEQVHGDYFGAPLNRLARLLAAGHGGQILLSQATAALVGDALPEGATVRAVGTHTLKDLLQPEPIFQLVTLDLPSEFPPLRSREGNPPATPTLPPHLLATKLYAPPARPDLVARPRLFERLTAGLSDKLTLIAAPAGFGKTTLVSAWIAEMVNGKRQTANDHAELDEASVPFTGSVVPFIVAWVSLDARDNDSTRFFCYVSAALNTLAPGSGDTALALLQAPQPPPLEAIVTTLLNALSATLPQDQAGNPAVLVLDDYHTIEAPAIHHALATLLEHLPPQLHFILATRADPPLPLARLRASRQLTELRAADLRFSLEEAATLLTEVMGLPLSAADIAALEARTEGWIAGLQLAALAMRDRSDLAGFIGAFTGSNRFVMRYLAEEVFGRQPLHLQTFLLHTAVLERMCGPLCDAILGLIPDQGPGADDQDSTQARASVANVDQQPAPLVSGPSSESYSQLILDQLSRANLFVISLDDERLWYRYHHLFAEVLRHRLMSGASTTAIMALHRQAAQWFERQGLVAEAIQHTLSARDVERAAVLIEQVGPSMGTQGQVYTVLGWLNALPDQVIRAHPVLCIIHAAMLMYTNHLPDALDRLSDAERCVGADAPADQARGILGQTAALRGNIARFVGDRASCIRLARQALELLPETEVFAHAGPLMRIGRVGALVDATYDFLVSGDATADVEQRVRAVITTARAGMSLFATLRSINLLARLQIMQGRLRAAAATYAEVAEVVPGQSAFRTLVNSAAYYVGMGELLHEWNDLDSAERYLAQGIELVRGALTVDAHVTTRGFLALARLQQARGDFPGAAATLDECVNLARRRNFVADLSARMAAAQAQLWLAQDNLAAARRWAARSGLHTDDELTYPREAEYLTLARLLIALGQDDPAGQTLQDALRLLDRLLIAAEAGARMRSVIEILILRTLALRAQTDLAGALAALERALSLAESEGYIRSFVDEGAPMADLLREASARGITPAYVARLLAAFGKDEGGRMKDEAPSARPHPSSFIPQPLAESLSERELEILQLIADGFSNQAIADRLVIALSTVKRHINNIYGKLAVQSRTQALMRARELKLL